MKFENNNKEELLIPNEDLNDSCKSCLNFGRGTAQSSDAGTLYLGLIYGKY